MLKFCKIENFPLWVRWVNLEDNKIRKCFVGMRATITDKRKPYDATTTQTKTMMQILKLDYLSKTQPHGCNNLTKL